MGEGLHARKRHPLLEGRQGRGLPRQQIQGQEDLRIHVGADPRVGRGVLPGCAVRHVPRAALGDDLHRDGGEPLAQDPHRLEGRAAGEGGRDGEGARPCEAVLVHHARVRPHQALQGRPAGRTDPPLDESRQLGLHRLQQARRMREVRGLHDGALRERCEGELQGHRQRAAPLPGARGGRQVRVLPETRDAEGVRRAPARGRRGGVDVRVAEGVRRPRRVQGPLRDGLRLVRRRGCPAGDSSAASSPPGRTRPADASSPPRRRISTRTSPSSFRTSTSPATTRRTRRPGSWSRRTPATG